MRFLSPLWLFGALAAACVLAAVLVVGAFALGRARVRFAEPARAAELVTFDAASRRATKAVLGVLAVVLAFVALARPQASRGQRLVPATNLDVVLVLDFSKSMYARDVLPSRIAQAKAEVGRLTRELAGARFGAVAFAGEAIGFPLTSDGAAIAQFLRQNDPNDMPVGGTAIGRALERAREILARDPKSKDHRRVIVLITDGEDLEGNPLAVAQAAADDGDVIDVVQIGGRTPERIPDVAPDGRVVGWRTDDHGQPLTTALTTEGEAQLTRIAELTHGAVVRAQKGSTGIDQITQSLKRMMTEELSERVETVFEDKYGWPLGAALVLLALETFVNEAPPRRAPAPPTGPRAPARPTRGRRRAA